MLTRVRCAALLAVFLGSPAAASVVGQTMICSTLTTRQVKAAFGLKNRIAAWCTNYQTGEIVGGLLRKNGTLACSIHGVATSATCGVVSVCGGPLVSACV
jgi:hypothetical protein